MMPAVQRLSHTCALLIKDSPPLYRAHLTLRGKYRPENFPSSDTDFCIEGYGRSGNTYSVALIKQLLPSFTIASHVHTQASIKLALTHRTPLIVLVRDPGNCTASAVVKERSRKHSAKNPIQWHLRAYIHYYRYILRHIKQIELLEFGRLIQNNKLLVDFVTASSGATNFSETEIVEAAAIVKQRLKADTRVPAENTWFSEEKERLKAGVLSQIQHYDEFLEARIIFDQLKTHSL